MQRRTTQNDGAFAAVFYDADCSFCVNSARRFERALARRRFELVPLQAALWQAITVAGIAGFGTAVGVHPAIGYMSFSHLGPAVMGCIVFAAGLALAAQHS
jgi:hypothetical protein